MIDGEMLCPDCEKNNWKVHKPYRSRDWYYICLSEGCFYQCEIVSKFEKVTEVIEP